LLLAVATLAWVGIYAGRVDAQRRREQAKDLHRWEDEGGASAPSA
jgi:hypothetical protein